MASDAGRIHTKIAAPGSKSGHWQRDRSFCFPFFRTTLDILSALVAFGMAASDGRADLPMVTRRDSLVSTLASTQPSISGTNRLPLPKRAPLQFVLALWLESPECSQPAPHLARTSSLNGGGGNSTSCAPPPSAQCKRLDPRLPSAYSPPTPQSPTRTSVLRPNHDLVFSTFSSPPCQLSVLNRHSTGLSNSSDVCALGFAMPVLDQSSHSRSEGFQSAGWFVTSKMNDTFRPPRPENGAIRFRDCVLRLTQPADNNKMKIESPPKRGSIATIRVCFGSYREQAPSNPKDTYF